jgi:hypothetical protein
VRECDLLFFIGNKRSGTSWLVRLLNSHPEMFIAHEADLVWILFQMQRGWPEGFHAHEWDAGVGMSATLETCGDLLHAHAATNGAVSRRDLFVQAIRRLQEWGSRVQRPCSKDRTRWVGDKKPVQQCDPRVYAFASSAFPGARYVHVVRHPFAVVTSMQAAAKEWSGGVPPYWHGGTEHLLERWTIHEEWVLRVRQDVGERVYTIRHEDACQDAAGTLDRICDFLHLDRCQMPVAEKAGANVNDKYAGVRLAVSAATQRMMDRYGYTADGGCSQSSA